MNSENPTEIFTTDSDSINILGSETTHEFIRYFVASGIALTVDIILLWIFTAFLSIQYLISGALSFFVGLIVIYVLSVVWVFRTRTVTNRRKEFFIFVAIGIIGLGLNEIVLLVFTGWLGLFLLFSKVISLGFVFSWNFIARKIILFSKI